MENLTVKSNVALAEYNMASNEQRVLLERIFGKTVFNQNITDKIKSFEDACRLLGAECDEPMINSGSKDEIAYKKLKVIIQALNEGWTPDWSDEEQPKYWPWFQFKGSGFSFDDVDYYYAVSGLGSRLCFRSRELAEYAAKQFVGLYNDFLL